MTKKISIRLSADVLSSICEKYNISTQTVGASDIRRCLLDAVNTRTFTGNKSCRLFTPAQTLEKVITTKLRNPKLCCWRIDDELIKYLKSYYKTSSTSYAIRCAIFDVFNTTTEPLCVELNNKLFFMPGQKNSNMLAWLNPIFSEATSRYNLKTYLEPFTGTANVLLHTQKMDTELINDFSYDLINLHNTIKKYPAELKIRLSNMIISSPIESTFKKCKEFLQTAPIPKRHTKHEDIKRASSFFIIRYFSYYGDGSSFNRKKNIGNFLKSLDYFYAFSQRLQNADIKKSDAIYRLKTFMNKSDSLIYIDAPYINTESYYKINQPEKRKQIFSNHRKLRNIVDKLRTNNVCLISYRITASISALEKDPNAEKHIRNSLDRLYLNCGYFYSLHKLPKNQTEILLSTHALPNFISYDIPLLNKEVE